jgi:Spy/CpxP family protein refolding chaperone
VQAFLTLALSATVVSTAQAQGAMGRPPGEHPHRMGRGMEGGPMINDRMLDAVGASAEQKTRVREIMSVARDEIRKAREGDRGLHQQMMVLLAAPKIDPAAAEALRQKLMASHDVTSKRRMQAMLDAAAVLSPEQRQKLAERLKTRHDMMERHQRERQATERPS